MNIQDFEEPKFFRYFDAGDYIFVRVYWKGLTTVFRNEITSQITASKYINCLTEKNLKNAKEITPEEFELEYTSAMANILKTSRY